MDYKQLMLDRINRRKEQFLKDFRKVEDSIKRGKVGGEANRIWMEEQIKGLTKGLDICCGDMIIGENSTGIDGAYRTIGPTWHFSGDALNLYHDNGLEYIVTNYIEAFVDVFKALREWHRVLQPEGLLVFSCADADKYHDDLGPFCNAHRANIFTKKTIINFLNKAQFRNIYVEDGEERSMRIRCQK